MYEAILSDIKHTHTHTQTHTHGHFICLEKKLIGKIKSIKI